MRIKLTRRLGRRDCVAAGALIALLAVAASAASQAANDEASYAGGDTCVACHEEIADALMATPHGRQAFANRSDYGCESCHGPAAAHVDDPSIEANQPRISRLSVEQQNATCTGCHSGGQQFFWQGSAHETRGLACTECHSVHSAHSDYAQLKTKQTADTCYSCHADVRSQTLKASHHPIREGEISCSDCHNPHGTQTKGQISAISVNEKCYECHAEKRGPFLWEHAPVRENCLNCHLPHGSNHQKLQVTSNPYICQQCHSNTRHPGTLYDATTLPGRDNARNRIFNRGCVNCHPAIHGSNHPSGPYLGR